MRRREKYESIGGGSPIVRLTQEQADNLCLSLKKRGIDAKAYIGMRYWYPFTEVPCLLALLVQKCEN